MILILTALDSRTRLSLDYLEWFPASGGALTSRESYSMFPLRKYLFSSIVCRPSLYDVNPTLVVWAIGALGNGRTRFYRRRSPICQSWQPLVNNCTAVMPAPSNDDGRRTQNGEYAPFTKAGICWSVRCSSGPLWAVRISTQVLYHGASSLLRLRFDETPEARSLTNTPGTMCMVLKVEGG